MLRYAAHDAFFLVLIAQKQVKRLMERRTEAAELVDAPNSVEFSVWFQNLQVRLTESLHLQIAKMVDPEEQRLALKSSLRKAFRVCCDHFRPESDEWLRCQYLFRNLFVLRDETAQLANTGAEQLISNEHLYMMARQAEGELL